MGKHNGKARKTGLNVGSALVNRAKREGKTNPATAHLHTTELDDGKNMQSVLESNDLEEMMSMATLAGRDFTAEKQQVIVISTGAVGHVDQRRMDAERRAAEERHRHRLRLPRRPPWTASMSPDELDNQEREAFYEWRRDLAGLEQEEHLVLTPFEKNLEVWRQLWRVLERSDIVVQVVDSRDPLTYRSPDLEAYSLELHPFKRSLILLNKADLLPHHMRCAWADYFDAKRLDHVFWSAKAASEELEQGTGAAPRRQEGGAAGNPRTRVLGVEELLEVLESKAGAAVQAAEARGLERAGRSDRLVVGLIGYPNVGKSSTINALFGSKKTAVAATPGKTKHFQTLHVSDTLCLCDCPGLVLPQYAHSKAEMVAAGVIPIDRLTDYRGPLETVACRIPRQRLEDTYGLRLPPAPLDNPHRPPHPQELLRSFALSRGWVGASGLPDETRCSRRILKDYVDGKLLYCKPPPGSTLEPYTGASAGAAHHTQRAGGAGAAEAAPSGSDADSAWGVEDGGAAEDGPVVQEALGGGEEVAEEEGEEAGDDAGGLQLSAADLELRDELDIAGGKKAKQVRAEHKFHKKAARSKGDRGQKKEGAGAGYDGSALPMGKRGGLVRVAGY